MLRLGTGTPGIHRGEDNGALPDRNTEIELHADGPELGKLLVQSEQEAGAYKLEKQSNNFGKRSNHFADTFAGFWRQPRILERVYRQVREDFERGVRFRSRNCAGGVEGTWFPQRIRKQGKKKYLSVKNIFT